MKFCYFKNNVYLCALDMKNLISKIWFPIVLTGAAAVQSFGIDAGRYGKVLEKQAASGSRTALCQ